MGIPRNEWGSQAQWAITAPLLGVGLCGIAWGPIVAFGLCAASALYYLRKLRSVRAYRVQIRLGLLALLALASMPALAALLWLPLLGTSAQVLFGYCPMARFLDLLPWNRDDALSVATIVAVVTRPPGSEGLFIRAPSA